MLIIVRIETVPTGSKRKAFIYQHLYGCLADLMKKKTHVARRIIFIFSQSHAGRQLKNNTLARCTFIHSIVLTACYGNILVAH